MRRLQRRSRRTGITYSEGLAARTVRAGIDGVARVTVTEHGHVRSSRAGTVQHAETLSVTVDLHETTDPHTDRTLLPTRTPPALGRFVRRWSLDELPVELAEPVCETLMGAVLDRLPDVGGAGC